MKIEIIDKENKYEIASVEEFGLAPRVKETITIDGEHFIVTGVNHELDDCHKITVFVQNLMQYKEKMANLSENQL